MRLGPIIKLKTAAPWVARNFKGVEMTTKPEAIALNISSKSRTMEVVAYIAGYRAAIAAKEVTR